MAEETTNSNKLSEKDKKVEQYIIKLKTGKEDQVLTALKGIRTDGNENVIPFIVDALAQTSSPKVEKEITTLLLELKTVKVIEPLLKAIEEPNYKEYHPLLVSVFWNAGLNPIDHVQRFVEFAIEGDFMTCLECLTVIENLEGEFEEEQLLEGMVLIKNFLGKNKNHEKAELLRSMEAILKQFDNNQ